jgi:hypothetical protein
MPCCNALHLKKMFETAGDLVLWACHSPTKKKRVNSFYASMMNQPKKFITKHVPLCLHETAQQRT